MFTAVLTSINMEIKRSKRRSGNSLSTNLSTSGEITPPFESTFSAFIHCIFMIIWDTHEEKSLWKMYFPSLAVLRLPTSVN